ncbi:MAG: hypothetical protein N2517_09090 [Ignavibacteria bacterium]|nr:hypothetical protein [Ignavibacteria bacterium]
MGVEVLYRKAKFSFFFLILLIVYRANGQPLSLANVILDSVTFGRNNTLEFVLRLERLNERWQYWANGTFQFQFDSIDYNVSPDRHTIELIPGTSDLKITAIPGILPITSYIVTPNVLPGRFSITIAGPKEYQNCIVPPTDNRGIVIGKFVISTKDGTKPPSKLKWLEPYLYYQACSYKLDHDSVFIPNLFKYEVNDNVEMDDGIRSFVNYEVSGAPSPQTKIKYFNAEYIGLKKLKISWETLSEAYVDGFIVVRGLRGPEVASPEVVPYLDTVADYRRSEPNHRALLGLGTSSIGKVYNFEFDSVDYRGFEYCYKLIYKDFFGNFRTLAYDCERIPNSIISKATASPNPFSLQTRIDFVVEDDVVLDAFINDYSGRIVDKIFENVYFVRGQHSIDIYSYNLAQQGLYNVVFIAYPIDDPTVEISRAIVKLQLIR